MLESMRVEDICLYESRRYMLESMRACCTGMSECLRRALAAQDTRWR